MDLDPSGSYGSGSNHNHNHQIESSIGSGRASLGSVDRLVDIPQVILDRATALKYRLSHFYTNLLSETIDREKRFVLLFHLESWGLWGLQGGLEACKVKSIIYTNL